MPPYQYQFPQRALVNQSDQSRIENAQIPRSTFINNWTRKSAYNASYLYPILVDEILPGDHMTYRITAYLRMATPLFPIFDMQTVDTHFFFVPCRLVWENWTRFMGEQPSGSQETIAYDVPRVRTATGGNVIGTLYDHFGLPSLQGQNAAGLWRHVNALPFRAYNLIYNEWFRDENQPNNAAPVQLGDALDTAFYPLLRRAKPADYFTSALPWPQKFTAPTIPLAGNAPVVGIGAISQVYADLTAPPIGPFYEATGGAPVAYPFGAPTDTSIINQFFIRGTDDLTGYPAIYADLSAVTGISINTLRQAWMVQSLLERDARGGTRYVELLRSHFGVVSPDFRLQRPEYIGGGRSELNITPIAQTAPTAGVPLGAIGGAGTSAGQHTASYAATEHGYIIGLLSIRSEQSYQYGMHKMWQRTTRYDFYWPALAQLGEQAVTRDEIWSDASANDDIVFGYQERWQEYRTKYSDVTGIMRSFATGTLDAWHLAENWNGAPIALDMTFIQDNSDQVNQRVLAAGSAANGQQYLASILYQRTAVRPLPTFGTPVALSRF